jgi:hypothetical protein
MWAMKRSVMARIQAWSDQQAGTGLPLDGVQIAYTMPPQPERVCVYGGRPRAVRELVTGERAVMFREDITVEVRVRVVELGDDAQDAERTAEQICQQISQAVSAEPQLSQTGPVAVAAVDEDPIVLGAGPEPSTAVNVALTVSASLMTAGA